MATELFDSGHVYSAPAGAQLTFRGGPLLNAVKLVGVYFDDFPYEKEMSAFLDWFSASDVLASLQEYNVSGFGSHIADVNLSLGGVTPPPPPPVPGCQTPAARSGGWLSTLELLQAKRQAGRAGLSVVTDSDLQAIIENAIAAGQLPPNDADTLYVLFLPDGVSVVMGTDASCSTFCGYHSNTQMPDGTPVFYAVHPFPSCSGCQGGLSEIDALTSIVTHEIAEAVTDPIPGSGWYDDANGEIGDICAWQQKQDGQYTVQLLWSNAANSCV